MSFTVWWYGIRLTLTATWTHVLIKYNMWWVEWPVSWGKINVIAVHHALCVIAAIFVCRRVLRWYVGRCCIMSIRRCHTSLIRWCIYGCIGDQGPPNGHLGSWKFLQYPKKENNIWTLSTKYFHLSVLVNFETFKFHKYFNVCF